MLSRLERLAREAELDPWELRAWLWEEVERRRRERRQAALLREEAEEATAGADQSRA